MAQAKPKLCKVSVRKGDERAPCNTLFVDKCTNSNLHIQSLKTGFCSNGWHEGTRAIQFDGAPAPTCHFIDTCPCDCHDSLSKLYAISGMERVVVDVSEYKAPPRKFWLPSDDPIPVSSNSDDTPAPVLLESPAPNLVPARMERDFGPTATGRAARGQLEHWVRIECDAWLIDEAEELCTPSLLARIIGREYGITDPSVGAINAVFERWIKLGFAVIAKKPTRFVGYTEDGIRLGLEGMKAREKRLLASQKGAQRRGIR